MEYDSFITSDGVEYLFQNDVDKFGWGYEGQGKPEMTVRTERGPFQHGDTLLGYVLRPRVINLVHRVNACSRQEYWDKRNAFLDIIRPNRHGATFDVGVLRKVMPDGSKRDLRVMVESGPNYAGTKPGQWMAYSYQEPIRFTAYDPIFYDPDEVIVVMNPASLTTQLTFPITFPILFSPSENTEAEAIAYYGTWEALPKIYINGPVSMPVVKNITTGETMALNYDVAVGDTVTIELTYGNISITNSMNENLAGLLIEDSILHIVPHPYAPNGVNSIGYAGDGMDTNTSFIIRYFIRYIGI